MTISATASKFDEAIRRGAQQIRMQLVSDRYSSNANAHATDKSVSTARSDSVRDHSSQASSSKGTTSTELSSREQSAEDYRELLHITPQETLMKLRELDQLHNLTEQKGMERLRKLQNLEGRVTSQNTGGSSASGRSSGRSSVENYSYRKQSFSSTSTKTSILKNNNTCIRPENIATLDLRPLSRNSKRLPKEDKSNGSSQRSVRSHVTFDLKLEEKGSPPESPARHGMDFYQRKLPDSPYIQTMQEMRKQRKLLETSSKTSKTGDGSSKIQTKKESDRKCKLEPRKSSPIIQTDDDLLVQEHIESPGSVLKIANIESIHKERREMNARTTKESKTEDDMLTKEQVSIPPSDTNVSKSTQMTTCEDIADVEPWRQNEAYIHAMSAGTLWQTLVGEHVRFPKEWFDGERTPRVDGEIPSKWRYIAKNRVRNSSLNSLVKRRGGGRILLHLVVRDAVSSREKEDVVIGCFHPHSRGLVSEEDYKKRKDEFTDTDVREIWMAIRSRNRKHEKISSSLQISTIQPLLLYNRSLADVARRSPLYTNDRLSNENIRAVFGGEPPLETISKDETELLKILESSPYSSPKPISILLLQHFIFQ